MEPGEHTPDLNRLAKVSYGVLEGGAGLPLFAVTQPQWNATVSVPLAPQFAGLPIALQCFYSPTNGPLGYDLSNGVWARLGY